MSTATDPPGMPALPCRSKLRRRTPEEDAARSQHVSEGMHRRAVRVATAQDRLALRHARLAQRVTAQRMRQSQASGVMRAIGDLRGQLAVLAALLNVSPWPPPADASGGAGKTKRRRSRRMMTPPATCTEAPPFDS